MSGDASGCHSWGGACHRHLAGGTRDADKRVLQPNCQQEAAANPLRNASGEIPGASPARSPPPLLLKTNLCERQEDSQEASQVTAGCVERGPQKRPCHVPGSAHAGLPPCAEATPRLCTPEEYTRGHKAHIAVNRGFSERNAHEARKLRLSSLPGTVLTHPGHAALQGALVTRPLGGPATRASEQTGPCLTPPPGSRSAWHTRGTP